MKITNLMTDEAVLAELGERVARARLLLNLTQAETAARAGVGKRTLERLERGLTVQVDTFVRVARVLGLLEGLDFATAPPEPGPYDLLRAGGRQRQRARPRPYDTDRVAENPAPFGRAAGADHAEEILILRPPTKPVVWGEDK